VNETTRSLPGLVCGRGIDDQLDVPMRLRKRTAFTLGETHETFPRKQVRHELSRKPEESPQVGEMNAHLFSGKLEPFDVTIRLINNPKPSV